MKNLILAACIGTAIIAASGFGQTGGPLQKSSVLFQYGPGMKVVSYTVTYGLNGLPIMTVKGKPYSATQIAERRKTLTDGTNITESEPSFNVYRDSAGRTKTDRPAASPGPLTKAVENMPVIPEIFDPVSGDQYILDTGNRIAHHYKISAEPSQLPMKIDARSTGKIIQVFGTGLPGFGGESLGTRMIDGISAEGRQMKTIFPAGMMGNEQPIVSSTETWESPELNVTLLTKNVDPRTGENIRALINISREEPDPGLFQVPVDYRVVDETGPFTMILSSRK
jgi:hypothetical protein